MARRILITGIAKGIGRAIAEKFLENGDMVVGTYFNSESKARELLEQYGEERVRLLGPYDFQDTDQIEELLTNLMKYSFDSVICNSGMFSNNDDFTNFDLEEFKRIMNCNFYAAMILCIGLQKNIVNGGSIVIISSNDAYSGAYTSMSYSISKAALISLTKCLCVNFGSKHIRVNSVSPGAINTNMNTDVQMDLSPQYTPIERVGQPNEVANVVYFLTSEEASFVNGENITIDGGFGDVNILLKSEADTVRGKESE